MSSARAWLKSLRGPDQEKGIEPETPVRPRSITPPHYTPMRTPASPQRTRSTPKGEVPPSYIGKAQFSGSDEHREMQRDIKMLKLQIENLLAVLRSPYNYIQRKHDPDFYSSSQGE